MKRNKKPLRRTGLKRKTPLRRRKPERAPKLRAEDFGVQAAYCRTLPCCICARPGNPNPTESYALYGSVPHHDPSRGAGGTDKDAVPLCHEHHDEFHTVGRKTFRERYGVDLRAVAASIHEALTAEATP